MSVRGVDSVEDYAADAGMAASKLVSMILDGQLPGERRGDRWFVAAPLVVLEPFGSERGADALLKIAACCLGSYVTAGRGELGIRLRSGDPGRAAALEALNSAMSAAADTPPESPVDVCVNGEHFMIDSSLWLALSAALVEYATLQGGSVEEAL